MITDQNSLKNFFIGKVSYFSSRYIYLRYNYNDFKKYSNEIEIGQFLLVSSYDENKYILSQIVDIYDVVSYKEEDIRTSISNNGNITSLERDIYLFIELKIKPLFLIDNDKISWNLKTIRLKDIFWVNSEIRKKIFDKIINSNFSDDLEFLTFDLNGCKIFIRGIIFSIGLQNCFENIKSNKKIDFINFSELKNFNQYSTKNKNLVVFIENRYQLLKLSNLFFIPDFIIGKNLLKIDYDIILRIFQIRNDYLDIFSDKVYLIHKGIIFF